MEAAKNKTYTLEMRLDRFKPIPDTDRELAYRLAAGDERALRELVVSYGQRMYAYALRLTGEPARAEAVVQASQGEAWPGR